jgi:thiol-disulfide isomerase/thioredoxin
MIFKTGKSAAAVILLVLFFSQVIFAGDNKIDSLEIGSQAPSFTLPDLNSSYVFLRDFCGEKLRKPWKNKVKHVVVVSFFATWCVPCQKEIPHLMKIREKFKSRPVKFFLIDVGEKLEEVSPFVKKNGYTIPVLLDQYQVTKDKYGAHSLPRLVVLDKNGMVRHYKKGFENAASFENEMTMLLEKLSKE